MEIDKYLSHCPLCNSNNKIHIEKVNAKEINFLYKKLTGEDFSYLLNGEINFEQCLTCSLKFYYPFITGDEKFYSSLQKFYWYYFDDKNEYFFAKKFIKKGDIVLDVGCGKGDFSKHVNEIGGIFLGLDTSINAKKLAEKQNIKILNENIQQYSFKNPNSVDVVTSFQVCEHVSNLQIFIEAKINSLKSAGRMIIAVPSDDSFLQDVTNGVLNMPPHHISRWKDDVFYYIAARYNLEILTIHHEFLQPVHRRWFLSTLIQNALIQKKIIDISLKRMLVGKIANLLANFFEGGISDAMAINGHTVIAVFQKK
jgi:2-polyprenyl-3-methyl-5-hydroxy-6-metoxy-1,4-benzoquinol methylase